MSDFGYCWQFVSWLVCCSMGWGCVTILHKLEKRFFFAKTERMKMKGVQYSIFFIICISNLWFHVLWLMYGEKLFALELTTSLNFHYCHLKDQCGNTGNRKTDNIVEVLFFQFKRFHEVCRSQKCPALRENGTKLLFRRLFGSHKLNFLTVLIIWRTSQGIATDKSSSTTYSIVI